MDTFKKYSSITFKSIFKGKKTAMIWCWRPRRWRFFFQCFIKSASAMFFKGIHTVSMIIYILRSRFNHWIGKSSSSVLRKWSFRINNRLFIPWNELPPYKLWTVSFFYFLLMFSITQISSDFTKCDFNFLGSMRVILSGCEVGVSKGIKVDNISKQ